MSDKFEYYELFSIFIPGTLLVGLIPFCFPAIAPSVSNTGFPDAFVVIILTASAVFLGQLVQAIASLVEPALFWTWGGRPSNRALTDGIPHYMPVDSAKRIRTKLQQRIGVEATTHALFLFAMQRSDGADIGRARRFNSLYAYHRGLVVLVVVVTGMLALSMQWGRAAQWDCGLKTLSLIVMGLLAVLMWYRAKQRAFYYVREVLHTSERVLDDKKEG